MDMLFQGLRAHATAFFIDISLNDHQRILERRHVPTCATPRLHLDNDLEWEQRQSERHEYVLS